jgi:hypothetical protein
MSKLPIDVIHGLLAPGLAVGFPSAALYHDLKRECAARQHSR